MRLLVQRVTEARVEIDQQVVGQIGPGLLALLGITHDDGSADIDYLLKKLLQLRIFTDENGKMNLSLPEVGGSLLVVSQFTLYGSTQKGNRPAYTRSARPAVAIPLYEQFLTQLRQSFAGPVATGQFGASMQVHLCNDGPVTLMLDSQDKAW
jgi:D-tyrosyl-tRNA(Tyr) deacylase